MLRDFAPNDQEAVRDVVIDGLRERWGDVFDPSYNADLSNLADNYLARGGEIVVIEMDDRIVATGTLIPEENGCGRIVRMSVAASHRRRGLGRMVVDELVERATRRRFTTLLVFTDTPWTSALELYRSCGFTEVGQDESDTYFAMSLDS